MTEGMTNTSMDLKSWNNFYYSTPTDLLLLPKVEILLESPILQLKLCNVFYTTSKTNIVLIFICSNVTHNRMRSLIHYSNLNFNWTLEVINQVTYKCQFILRRHLIENVLALLYGYLINSCATLCIHIYRSMSFLYDKMWSLWIENKRF